MRHLIIHALRRSHNKRVKPLYYRFKILRKASVFLEVAQCFLHNTNVVEICYARALFPTQRQNCLAAHRRKGHQHYLHLTVGKARIIVRITTNPVFLQRFQRIIGYVPDSAFDVNPCFCVALVIYIYRRHILPIDKYLFPVVMRTTFTPSSCTSPDHTPAFSLLPSPVPV